MKVAARSLWSNQKPSMWGFPAFVDAVEQMFGEILGRLIVCSKLIRFGAFLGFIEALFK